MGKVYESITPELATWIGQQHVFFVATAPLAGDGHVNCSPKGLDTFRIIDGGTAAYLDLTGSGSETVAHVRENGRIVLMFCAFDGPPKIVRLHGRAKVVALGAAAWAVWAEKFPEHPTARAIVVIDVRRISDSCGYGVPTLEYKGEREAMRRWAQTKGLENLAAYRREKNARSIDGLPAADFGS